MAPEHTLETRFPQHEANLHLCEDLENRLVDEVAGDGGAISLAKYRAGRIEHLVYLCFLWDSSKGP